MVFTRDLLQVFPMVVMQHMGIFVKAVALTVLLESLICIMVSMAGAFKILFIIGITMAMIIVNGFDHSPLYVRGVMILVTME